MFQRQAQDLYLFKMLFCRTFTGKLISEGILGILLEGSQVCKFLYIVILLFFFLPLELVPCFLWNIFHILVCIHFFSGNSLDLEKEFEECLNELEANKTDTDLNKHPMVVKFVEKIWKQHHAESEIADDQDEDILISQVVGDELLCPITKVS